MRTSVVTQQTERRLGLQKLVPVEGATDTTTVDVIAIHGLDTESPRTWLYEKNGRQVHWLRDSNMLPAAIPEARIYTYDWSAKVFDDAAVQTLLGHADNLLGLVAAERGHDNAERPLVFVASCFGGLILVEAIFRAAQDGGSYRDVLLPTAGVVFLATPFAGTDAAKPAAWAVTIKGIMGKHASNKLIKDLERRHEHVYQRVQKFAEVTLAESTRLPISCFFETDTTNIYSRALPKCISKQTNRYTKSILVTESSACIHGHYRQGLHRTHTMMNKFDGPNDPHFQLVRDQIRELVSGAQKTLKRRRNGVAQLPFLVPFSKNENFVGRDTMLRQLLKRIPPAAHPDTCQRTVIEGLGGIGKTQVAIEAAYRVQKAHPDCSVFWVPAVDKTTFENAYRDIGRALGLKGLDDNDVDVTKLVKEALSHDGAGSWLLIIDNADHAHLLVSAMGTDGTQLEFDAAMLASYLPFNRKGSILFTTRNHQVGVGFDPRQVPIRIDTLDYCDSIQLLHQGLQTSQIDDPHSTQQLLDQLAHLPLAIRQAAAYMASNSNVTIQTYLGYCRSSDETMIEILSEDFEDQDRYEAIQNPVATTWLISFRQILQNDPLAAEYLQFSCYLAEKDIPIPLLPLKGGEIKRDKAIGTLTAYAFITQRNVLGTASDRFDIHRLVRLVMRNWLREQGKDEAQVTSTVGELAGKLGWPTHETRETWIGYLPHTQALLQFEEKCTNKQGLWTILSYTGIGSGMLGRYDDAEPFRRKALKVAQKVFGEAHPSTLTSMNNLALVLSSQGKYEEAETMHRQTLEWRQKALGEAHPSTLTSMNNLANVLISQGKYEEAETMHRQTLERMEKALGEAHPSTLTSMNNLASVLSRQGKYEEAVVVHEKALSLYQKALGEAHPDTLTSMNNLALVLSSQGKYEEAETMHRQTLERMQKALGEAHPDTLQSMNNLAEVLSSQGKYEEAETMHRQTLERRQKALGEAHPSTLTSMNNLAEVLSRQGKYEEAETMHRQTLERTQKTLGEAHPDTLTSMNNLAGVLSSQGKYEEAETMHRQTLERTQKALGEAHPDTLSSMNNLASVLSSQGKYEEAETMHRQTLERRQKALGEAHPDTLNSMNNLALVLSSQGKYEEAETMHRQTLERRQKALGEAHPSTLNSMNNLALVLSSQGKYEEAETMHRQTLQGLRNTLGEAHPYTVQSRKTLAAVLVHQQKYEEANAIRQYTQPPKERVAIR